MATSSRPRWQPSGIITLTTDFGLQDGYVGTLEGVVLTHAPRARIVAVTHSVEPQDILGAAFHLRAAWPWFPPGTVHLAVVDPGVGTVRRSLVARVQGHVFVAPDNGLLPAALGEPRRSVEAEPHDVQYGILDTPRFLRAEASSTFHGRDLYAPVGARFAAGELDPDEAIAGLLEPTEVVRLDAALPRFAAGSAEGVIVQVDRFGNLVSNLAAADERVLAILDGAGPAWVEIAGRRAPIVSTYGDARPGDLVALVDSYRLVEVAVVDGNAAQVLGVGRGSPLVLASV